MLCCWVRCCIHLLSVPYILIHNLCFQLCLGSTSFSIHSSWMNESISDSEFICRLIQDFRVLSDFTQIGSNCIFQSIFTSFAPFPFVHTEFMFLKFYYIYLVEEGHIYVTTLVLWGQRTTCRSWSSGVQFSMWCLPISTFTNWTISLSPGCSLSGASRWQTSLPACSSCVIHYSSHSVF